MEGKEWAKEKGEGEEREEGDSKALCESLVYFVWTLSLSSPLMQTLSRKLGSYFRSLQANE